jgi:hypothetical protein
MSRPAAAAVPHALLALVSVRKEKQKLLALVAVSLLAGCL